MTVNSAFPGSTLEGEAPVMRRPSVNHLSVLDYRVRYGNYGTLGLSYFISCHLLPHFIERLCQCGGKMGKLVLQK